MTASPDDGQPVAAARRIGTRRSLLTRPDARTDATPLPATVRSIVSVFGIAVQGLVRFGYSLLVGRTLPAGFLSATNSAISTGMLATLLWPTSLGQAAAKFVARESGDVDTRIALTRYLARWSLATATGLGCVSAALTYWWLAPGEAVTAVFVGLLTVGWSGYTFTRSMQYASQRVLRATVWDAVSFVLAVGGLVAVLAYDVRTLLLLPITIGYLAYTVAGWPRTSSARLSPALRREITSFVSWGVVSSVATSGFLQLTMVLAQQTGGTRQADGYAAALTLATPASMLGTVLSLLLLPSLSEAVGRGDFAALRTRTDLAHRALVTLTGAVFGALVLGARLLVALFWPDLASAVGILEVLLAASCLLTMSTVVTESLLSYDDRGARTVATIRSSGFVVGLATCFVLIPRLGVAGIAIGYLVGMAVIVAVPVLLVWRRDRHAWSGYTTRVAAGAAVVLALLFWRGMAGTGWLDAACVVVFLAAWAGLHQREVRSLLVSLQPGKSP